MSKVWLWMRRIAAIFAAAVLAWRVTSLGMAEFYLSRSVPDPAAALAWRADYPPALRSLALQIEERDPAQAVALLTRAFQGDPSDGRVLMRMADLWRKQGQVERADRACELAERLFPADAQLHLQAAHYWLAAGNPQKTLLNWDLAMQINPQMAPPLFPVLLGIAKSQEGLQALRSVAAGLPPWWQGFFAYAAQNAAQVDTLRGLYNLRKQAAQPLEQSEVNAYLARLMREGLWPEAYMAWLNALSPEQHRVLGYVFDGGFELTAFQGGFDWGATPAKSVQVTTNYTQAVGGKRALHIVLHGRTLPTYIVEQSVFLLPGHYQFSGRARPDALQSAAGLEWMLECAATGMRLATSERFLGSDTWHNFRVDFHVAGPACDGVRLKLQPAGAVGEEREHKGEIWFDDVAIELAGEAAEAARSAATKAPAQSGAGSADGKPGMLHHSPKPPLQSPPAATASPPPAAR
jgi:tetratricopeptide (TPR) repeat protein